jgi:hypothetical protein
MIGTLIQERGTHQPIDTAGRSQISRSTGITLRMRAGVLGKEDVNINF